MKFSYITFFLPSNIVSVINILSKVRFTSPFVFILRKAWWMWSSFWSKRYLNWRSIKWDNKRGWWLEVEENLSMFTSHRIMACYNCHKCVHWGIQLFYNWPNTCEQVIEKLNMVELIIHCLGSSCSLVFFCLDYDSKKQMFKVKCMLEDVIAWC